jgi:hypothetical protein
LWGLIDFVPAQEYHAEVVAQVPPGGVVGVPFQHERSHNALVAEAQEALAVAQDLAEAEPELLFFDVVGDRR